MKKRGYFLSEETLEQLDGMHVENRASRSVIIEAAIGHLASWPKGKRARLLRARAAGLRRQNGHGAGAADVGDGEAQKDI